MHRLRADASAEALATSARGGGLFVMMFTLTQKRWKIDVVPGVCGAWGAIAASIFGQAALGGAGGVSLTAQPMGRLLGIGLAVVSGLVIDGGIEAAVGIRLKRRELIRTGPESLPTGTRGHLDRERLSLPALQY